MGGLRWRLILGCRGAEVCRSPIDRLLRYSAMLWLLVMLLHFHAAGQSNETVAAQWYYSSLVEQDTTIFAGSVYVESSAASVGQAYNAPFGYRTTVAIPDSPSFLTTTSLPNSLSTSYRANTISELFLTIALLYIEAEGLLPFSRTSSIPSSYLPSTYTGGTYLVNPSYTTVPITLNMLLQHVSSINEVGFSLGEASTPDGTATTLDAFVETLFSTEGSAMYNSCTPGTAACYYHSRSNTAIAAYVVQKILAGTTEYATYQSSIGDFLFSVVLPPLQLRSTFLLNRAGTYTDATYPATGTTNILPSVSINDLSASGTAVVDSFTIHAAYLSDYMLYTTTADLATILQQVTAPSGIYYSAMFSAMMENPLTIYVSSMSYTTARTVGLLLFDATTLCYIMYLSAEYASWIPYCSYNTSVLANSSSIFGIVATGAFSQAAIICAATVSGTATCSAAALSFYYNGWPTGNGAVSGNRVIGLAMVNLATLTSLPVPVVTTTAAPKSPSDFNGWYVLIGVLATVVVVIAASFLTDYIIQPPPPAKIVVPVATDQLGFRAVATGNGDGATPPPLSADSAAGSPSAASRGNSTLRRRRPMAALSDRTGSSNGRGDEEEVDEEEEDTPMYRRGDGPFGARDRPSHHHHRGRHGSRGGARSLRMEAEEEGEYQEEEEEVEEELDSAAPPSHHSNYTQRNAYPRDIPRFDAYI